jgi:hypothetical protein
MNENSFIVKQPNPSQRKMAGKLAAIAILMLMGCGRSPHNSPETKHEELFPPPGIEKAFISFRIGLPQSISDNRCKALIDLFEKYKGVTDEITFFTSSTHPPVPLDVFSHRIDVLTQRMNQARHLGYRTGINILSTIGHHNENLENSLKGPYTPMTDIDGKICNGSFCPNDEHLREYIRDLYTVTAKANPDYIWIDDDVRLAGHMPLYLTCFCDHCLRIFEKETGKYYSRESLKKCMNEGTAEQKLKLRESWIQHNRNTITRLFTLIEKTVHEIRPGMTLGFMTGDRFFEGYDFDTWARILEGPERSSVIWRPGGGYYLDNNTGELSGKSHDIGRQVSLLPGEIISIQSEIENFPYQRLKKAVNIVILEACSHIAAGCTGAAFNVLSMYDEPLDEYESLVNGLYKARPFFDLMVKTLGRYSNTGVQTFWNKDIFAAGNLTGGDWFTSAAPLVRHELYDIGLPACYSDNYAQVTILGKDDIYALKKEEIEKLLSLGVYMDAETLGQINELGYGDLTGFEIVKSENKDRIEKFTLHPLNGNYTGRERDNRQSFWNSPAYTLRKTNENAEALTSLIDYTGNQKAPCTMGIFENRLGGRICVAGYYPWTFMQNLSKSEQIKSVFRWLSKENLPGYIASFHKVNLWIREPRKGRIALAFSNSSFDPAVNVVLMIKTENRTLELFDMDCRETIIRSKGTDGPYQKFIIPAVDPWQMRLAVCE